MGDLKREIMETAQKEKIEFFDVEMALDSIEMKKEDMEKLLG
jgi:hypothetical protein